MTFKDFTLEYIDNLHNTLGNINLDEFENFFNLIKDTQSRMYIIGNGGSSSTASHMANDLAIGLKRRDIKTIDAISLSENSSVSYAISNDIGFENIFYMQLKDILKPEDTVVAISCSGNSPNIIKAVEYANTIGSKVVGLSGFDGGKLKELSDIKLHVQTQNNEYGLVEDIHLIINHIIFSYFSKENK